MIDPLIEPASVFGQSLDDPHHAERQDMVGMARMRGNSARRKSKTLPNSDAALQEEGTKASSAVETAVIDVVDEPIPDVMRVTAIEETRVTLRDSDVPTSRDIPEPDSFGP